MLAKLDNILQSFPQLQQDDILQHLPGALNPLSFLALNNANNTLTQSQMLCASNKQEFLTASRRTRTKWSSGNEYMEIPTNLDSPL